MEAKKRFIHDGFRISRESPAEGWTMPYAHYHDSYEIYVLVSGERTVIINGAEYTSASGSASLFGSLTPHRSKGEDGFSGICIHFSENYLDMYFSARSKRQLLKPFSQGVIYPDRDGLEYIKRVSEEFTPEAPDNFLILANILNILCKNISENEHMINTEQTGKPLKSQLITDYVNENYISIDKISDITERFGVSENYVFKVFRSSYGVTPKQYINSLRIKHACHRLLGGESTIRAIALECGYDSYERFSAVFKKLMKVTPTQYRNGARRRG